ncbi:MAG TPA: hypothetical protein PLU30_24235 [Verrucomicrobiae bacterium]|nr:hypothetical protein [Verrucomicrobiae bacterium]
MEPIESDFSELLSERGVGVEWKGRSFYALIGSPAVEYGLVAGGFDPSSAVMIRALREDVGPPVPTRGDRLTADGRAYKVTGITDNSNWPIITIHAELVT